MKETSIVSHSTNTIFSFSFYFFQVIDNADQLLGDEFVKKCIQCKYFIIKEEKITYDTI